VDQPVASAVLAGREPLSRIFYVVTSRGLIVKIACECENWQPSRSIEESLDNFATRRNQGEAL
jgi:hypothetical protein